MDADQSPPRTEYRKSDPAFRGKTLMDLQFTPSTSLYIKFEAPATPPTRTSSSTPPPAEASVPPVDLDALNFATRDDNQPWRPPLIPDLLDAAGELPLPPSFDPREPEQSTPGDDKGKGKAVDEAQKKKDKEDRLRRLLGGRSELSFPARSECCHLGGPLEGARLLIALLSARAHREVKALPLASRFLRAEWVEPAAYPHTSHAPPHCIPTSTFPL